MLINGSMNINSKTNQILKILDFGLVNKKLSTKTLNIRDLELPLYDPNNLQKKINDSTYQELYETRAFIIGSPEYHGGYTGALKNFIDYLNRDVFVNKPVALIACTGGVKSGINTLNGMRLVFRSLHADVIAQQAAISEREIIQGKLNRECLQSLTQIIDGIFKRLHTIH